MQVKGRGLIDIRMRPVVILAFGLPAITEEEFFGKDLLKNLIIFLKVDPAKVRIAGVRRIGQSRRRKRETIGIEVIIEIGKLEIHSMLKIITVICMMKTFHFTMGSTHYRYLLFHMRCLHQCTCWC